MPNLPYGYTVRIQSNGSSSPEAVPTNQWQRQMNGQPTFTDLSGQTGETYVVGPSDSNSKIRLKQKFGEGFAFSNELQVSEFVLGDLGYNGVLAETEVLSVGISADHKALAFGCKGGKCLFSGDGGKSWITLQSNVEDPRSIDPMYYDLNTPRILVAGSTYDSNDYNYTEIVTKTDNVRGRKFTSGSSLAWYGCGVMTDGRMVVSGDNGSVYSAMVESSNDQNWAGPVAGYSKSMSIPGGKGNDGAIFAQSASKVWRFYPDPSTGNFKSDTGPELYPSDPRVIIWQWAQNSSGLYLACGDSSKIFTNSSTFTNSRKWSVATCSAVPSGTKLKGCAWVKNKFWVAGIKSYKPYLASSPDGTTWSSEEMPSGLPDGVSVNWCKMVGHGDIGAMIFSEKDSHKTHVWNFT